MGFSQLFTDVITKAESILVDTVIPDPKAAKNFQKTPSNVNQLFKTINIWNDQIDEEILSDVKDGEPRTSFSNSILKCPALFIEFIPDDPKLILGGVTQYMDAKIYFHIFSEELNSPNSRGGDKMDQNLSIYDLRDSIKSTFLGFHTHNSSAMMSRYDSLDYKHKTITKYLLGFTFCFNDEKGSIFDPKSSRYQYWATVSATTNVTPKNDWIGGTKYYAITNVIYYAGSEGIEPGYYMCKVSNNSTEFTPSEWLVLAMWLPSTAYTAGTCIFNQYFVFRCSVDNSDAVFNPDNWELISRI